MSRLISLGALVGLGLASLGGCSTPASATDLNPAGPPMIRQVMMEEEFTDTAGNIGTRDNSLAFGHHDDSSFATDDGKVVTAVADPSKQKIRIVVDELLVGNYLEMIQCRAPVDLTLPAGSHNFSKVPIGSTPTDLANCSGTNELVQLRCTGEHTVCLNNTGKTQVTDYDEAAMVPAGAPVGIEDRIPNPDGDGVPDTDRFIEGAVRVMCTGVGGKVVEAPLALGSTYWQPSGNQQVPAHGGVAELGPALVISLAAGLPSGATCTFKFDPTVVDKDGNAVCAPPDGDVNQNCPSDGDTSLVQFGVAGLRLEDSQPVDGSTTVPTNKKITLTFNTSMDIASLAAGVTVTEGGVKQPITVMQEFKNMTDPQLTYDVLVNGVSLLDAGKTYVVTVPAGVDDFAGQPFGTPDFTRCPAAQAPTSQPCTYTFTTAP